MLTTLTSFMVSVQFRKKLAYAEQELLLIKLIQISDLRLMSVSLVICQVYLIKRQLVKWVMALKLSYTTLQWYLIKDYVISSLKLQKRTIFRFNTNQCLAVEQMQDQSTFLIMEFQHYPLLFQHVISTLTQLCYIATISKMRLN